MDSLERKRRWFTCKEKGKKKMLEYGTDKEELDRSESDTGKNKEEPLATKSELGKTALKSACRYGGRNVGT